MTGPFPHYRERFGVTAGAMRAAISEPEAGATSLATLCGDLAGDARRGRTLVEGDIAPQVQRLPRPAIGTARSLSANGFYAIGLARDYVGDVDTYDQAITALNAKYAQMVATQINAQRHEPDHRQAGTPLDQADIRSDVKARLNAEYLSIAATLEASVQGLVGKFGRGPSDADVADLIRRALIPLAAASVYPTLVLSPLDRALAQLSAGLTVPLPRGTTPADVNRWWASLDPSAQRNLTTSNPEFVGNTDGIPAAARNTANRARLPTLLREQEQYVRDHPDDAAAAQNLAGLRRLNLIFNGDDKTVPHPGYQLLLLDNSGHPLKAAVANGDVDQADIVSTWIGGTTSTVEGFKGDLIRLNNQSDEVAHQLDRATDDRTQVGILWLGYDAPDNIVDPGRKDEALDLAKQSWKEILPGHQNYPGRAMDVLLRDGGDTQDAINTRFAKEGAPVLAQFAEGIQATNPDARQTASAHSYGGAVLGGAAQRTDAYDTIVVSGTPGMQATNAGQLHVRDGVYVSEAQWRDQDYSGTLRGGRPDVEEILRVVKDGGDFVPDIGQVDGRFGSDPSDLDGVRLMDNGAVTIDGRPLGAAHGHSSYWDRDSHSLYNEANAIIGQHSEVSTR